MSGWWYRATTKQRLAQIDAAIELGLTAAVVAKNCGGNPITVNRVALYHDRHFSGSDTYQRREAQVRGRKRHFDIKNDKRAYLSGEPVDFWSAK